jgi:hypothetical protein
VKVNEAFNPVDIGLLGANAVVLAPDDFVNAIKKTGRSECIHDANPFRSHYPGTHR